MCFHAELEEGKSYVTQTKASLSVEELTAQVTNTVIFNRVQSLCSLASFDTSCVFMLNWKRENLTLHRLKPLFMSSQDKQLIICNKRGVAVV